MFMEQILKSGEKNTVSPVVLKAVEANINFTFDPIIWISSDQPSNMK